MSELAWLGTPRIVPNRVSEKKIAMARDARIWADIIDDNGTNAVVARLIRHLADELEQP